MKEYPCPTCGKVYGQQAHLDRHLHKKVPCSVVKDFACQCGKTYFQAAGLSRHKRTCKAPQHTLEEEVRALREQVQRLEAAVPVVQTPIVQTVNNVSHVTQHVTNNQNTTNINITLNSYGQEDSAFLDAMSYTDLKKALKLTPDHETILRMIRLIHLNDEHPENRTVKIANKDSDVLSIYKNGRWRQRPAAPTVYDLICRNRLRFVDVEGTLLKGMAKANFAALNEYLEKLENMANAEDASLHSEYAFKTLVEQIREELVNDN